MRENLANSSSEPKERRNSLIYRHVGIFNSKTLLAKHLKENILFDDSKNSGLLAINKPFGLSLLPGETGELSLNCALPDLASSLNVSNISVIKSVKFRLGGDSYQKCLKM